MTDKCDNCGKVVADNEQKSASSILIGEDKHFSIQVCYTKWDSAATEQAAWANTKKRDAWLCKDCFRTILSTIPVPQPGE